MIPDFKTYIGESVWGKVLDRGAGETIRKEDDVNHMDFDTFADYIKDKYSEKGDWFSIGESSDKKSRHIEIDIISGIDLSFHMFDGEINTILIQNNSNKYVDVPGLKKIFNVNILGSSTFSVVEKNWTKSNNTFVKLIEFFLEKKTNESVWGKVLDRGAGDIIRKEDDINHLDFYEFVEYLKNAYEVDDPSGFFEIGLFPTMGTDVINVSIPIEKKDIYTEQRYGNRMLTIGYDTNTKELVNIRPNKYVFELYPRELNKVFGDKFEIDHSDFELKPKDGVITNSLCVEVIDKLLDMVERPILTKK